MSNIQIVPDDVGLSAAQELSAAITNFSLQSRFNTSDLEHAMIEGARQVGDGITHLSKTLASIQPALSFALYATGVVLIIWCVINILEKFFIRAGDSRKKRNNRRRMVTSCWSRFKRWITGRNSGNTKDKRSREDNKDNISYKIDNTTLNRDIEFCRDGMNSCRQIPPPPCDSPNYLVIQR